MIEIAGLGVAMVNGHQKVKEKANYITINDNNNNRSNNNHGRGKFGNFGNRS